LIYNKTTAEDFTLNFSGFNIVYQKIGFALLVSNALGMG